VLKEQQRYNLKLKVQSADAYDLDIDMLKKPAAGVKLQGSNGKNKIYLSFQKSARSKSSSRLSLDPTQTTILG